MCHFNIHQVEDFEDSDYKVCLAIHVQASLDLNNHKR